MPRRCWFVGKNGSGKQRRCKVGICTNFTGHSHRDAAVFGLFCCHHCDRAGGAHSKATQTVDAIFDRVTKCHLATQSEVSEHLRWLGRFFVHTQRDTPELWERMSQFTSTQESWRAVQKLGPWPVPEKKQKRTRDEQQKKARHRKTSDDEHSSSDHDDEDEKQSKVGDEETNKAIQAALAVLNIPVDQAKEINVRDIHKAYRRCALLAHPDRSLQTNKEQPDMVLLNEAKTILIEWQRSEQEKKKNELEETSDITKNIGAVPEAREIILVDELD